MYLLYIAFTLELIALGFGVSMLIWAYRTQGVGVTAAVIFGYIITILSVIVVMATIYGGVKHYGGGCKQCMSMMQSPRMQQGGGMMMNKQNPQQPMMRGQQRTR